MIPLRPIGIQTAQALVDFGGRSAAAHTFAPDQLKGAVALHNILAERGFAYLADEVGMGKTYEALGLMAAVRERDPNARITILTPGPDLNRKWESELHRFGEGFAPTDVFRAWWSIADHLGDPRTTLGAFRGHVEGSLGAQAVWQRLHDTLTADDEARRLTRDEIWFYGAELLRTLRPIVAAIPEGPDAPAKRSVLATFLAHLEAELVPLSPDPTRGGWVAQVIAHYAVGGAPA